MKINNLFLDKCKSLLENMYNENNYLFSFSTKLNKGNYINDFNNELVYRYSINVFLGINKYNNIFNCKFFETEFDKFLSLHINKIQNIGDKGLLLYALTLAKHEYSEKILQCLIKLDKKELISCNLQEICWLIIGLTKYFEYSKNEELLKILMKYFSILNNYFLDKDSLLPHHWSKFKLRYNFVSFGGIVYFLKALYEYSTVLDDNYSKVIFKELVKKIIDLQAEDGSWGWFYSISNIKVVDFFQIYSVHQDSMALLFSVPAERLKIESSTNAIKKSVDWLFGKNILKQKMVKTDPFFIYRSIRRKNVLSEKFERGIRSLKNSILNLNDNLYKAKRLEINKECRSYHIGWILYVWSDFNDLNEFINLKLQKS